MMGEATMENVLESTLWEMLKLGVLTTDENEKSGREYKK